MRYIVGLLLFVSFSVVAAFFLCFIACNKTIALISLFLGCLVMILYFIKSDNEAIELNPKKYSVWTWSVFIIFLLFIFKAFLWLIYEKGDGLFVSSPNNIGDSVLHIAHIKYFASGVTFWPDSPIIADHKLRYPIGIDLFNSLLILLGIDLFRSLVLVGLTLAIVTGLSFLIWGGSFTLAGFLFNGGLAGFAYFNNYLFKDYQADLAWKSIPLAMFITQRGLLFAIPAGLLLLTSWRERFFGDEKSKLILPRWVEVVLYSSMPLFHMHTFIFLSLMLGIWLIISLFKKSTNRKSILSLILWSLIPATIFVVFLTDFFSAKSIISIKAGWMISDYHYNFVYFWLLNFGLLIPAVFVLCIKLISKREGDKTYFNFDMSKDSAFVLPAVGLFILFCVVMLAPWNWDNVKLLSWSYFVILPFLWSNLLEKTTFKVKLLSCFILYFSGFVCIVGGIDPRQGYKVVGLNEIRHVSSALKNIPINARFGCTPAFDHPLLLNGRKVAIGYPGWIWSHGYKLEEFEKKLNILMQGSDGWMLSARELGVDYIYWGKREEGKFVNSKKPWSKNKAIASGEWGEVYDIQALLQENNN